jgi:putative lipoprotein (rSAM/lipoprotein system)
MWHLLSLCLMLLGFSGCSNDDDTYNNHPIICMYGTPVTMFQAHGQVSSESGVPIPGLQVIVKPAYGGGFQKDASSAMCNADTVYTDDNGRFMSDKGTVFALKGIKVFLRDVDGESNGGTFADDSISESEMTVKKIAEGDKAFNRGSYTLSMKKTMHKK